MKKLILDASCGGRMMWFNKKHPNALYIDIRDEDKGFYKIRPNFEVKPDKVMDFRALEFPDKSFKLVVWDPPHIKRRNNSSWVSQKYGILHPDTWKKDIKKGFDECYRVLDDYGTLVFKWSTAGISLKDLLDVIKHKPLFGHSTGKAGNTKWMCFMKIPGENE